MNNKPKSELKIVGRAAPHTDVAGELAEIKAQLRALHDRPTTVYHITNHQHNARDGAVTQHVGQA